TLWLSNLLLRGDGETHILSQVDGLAAVVKEVPFHTVLVTNEVGMSVHPESALGRTFRDITGRAHQRLARGADEIYLAALGVIVRVHPGPVAIEPPGDFA